MSASITRQSALVAILTCLLLTTASVPGSALERSQGEYWVYSMQLTVPGFDVAADGLVKYQFVSEEMLAVEGAEVPTSVLRMTGTAAGSIDLIGLTASLVIEGYVYEGRGDVSIVRDDLTYWTNLTWGSGSFSWPINTASRVVTLYSPGLMHEFNPASTAPGTAWTETTLVRTVVHNVSTGAVESNETDVMTVEYTTSSELETVATGAGRFTALKISAVDDDGGRVVYWWSSEIGLFVKEETYVAESPEPVQTLVLGEYSGGSESNVLLFVAVGGGALAVALVALAVVLVKRRRGRPGAGSSPPLELLPPPP